MQRNHARGHFDAPESCAAYFAAFPGDVGLCIFGVSPAQWLTFAHASDLLCL